MQLWDLQSNEKTLAKRKLKGFAPVGSDPKDSPTTTTTLVVSFPRETTSSYNGYFPAICRLYFFIKKVNNKRGVLIFSVQFL